MSSWTPAIVSRVCESARAVRSGDPRHGRHRQRGRDVAAHAAILRARAARHDDPPHVMIGRLRRSFHQKEKAGLREQTGLEGCLGPGRYGDSVAPNSWLPWPVQLATCIAAPLALLAPVTSTQSPGAATFLSMKTPEPADVSPVIQAWALPPLQSWTSSFTPWAGVPPFGPTHLLLLAFIVSLTLPLPESLRTSFCGSPP